MPAPTNQNFIKKRECTNFCCLFIFFLFLLSWAVLSVFVYKYGDPGQIFLPTDSKGSACGKGRFADKPNLFYFNTLKCTRLTSLTTGCKTNTTCVKDCPNFTRSYGIYKTQKTFDVLSDADKKEIKKNLTCVPEVEKFDEKEIPYLLQTGQCASLYLKSQPRFGRCFPSELRKKAKGGGFLDDDNSVINNVTKEAVRNTSKAFAIAFNAKALEEMILSDVMASKSFILYGLLISVFVSYLWKYRIFSELNQTQLDVLDNDKLDTVTDIDLLDIVKVQFDTFLTDSRIWMLFLILSSILFFLLTLTFIALRQRVRIAISLIKEASKAIMEAKFALFLPLLENVLQFGLLVYAIAVALLIIAVYKPDYRFEDGPKKWQYCDSREANRFNCTKFQLLEDKYIYYVQGYNLFGLFWVWFFIHGMFQLIFAGVFSRYYWTYNRKKNLPSCLILNSTYTAFRYHLGSIALGSFLTATVKIIQVIIEWIDRKCKQYGENPVIKGIIWCMRCCFWLLENFLRYINTNAYVMIAVYGKGYFQSAKDAFNLILANIIRAVIIDKVADYLLLFGKLAVTGIMAVCTYYAIENYEYFVGHPFPELNYTHSVPILAISFGTYMIASSFFSVYEMAVNTIFLCFLKDCEENDGTDEKPYYMSSSLLKILNYKNKTMNKSLPANKVSDNSVELK